jgi:prepilin-type N-terminal cleavage/methylation domain-containing protein
MQLSGFTLIETVVALVIVSIVAAALATSTGSALRQEARAWRRERAAALAAEGLERLLAEPVETLRVRYESETVVADGEAFTRERTIETGPGPGLFHLSVAARASRGGASVTLATLRRVPWSLP